MRYGILVTLIIISIVIMIACSGGGGGGYPPLPTFDTSTTFFPTTTTITNPTTTTTFPTTTATTTTTTTNNNQQKSLYVKVLRKLSDGSIQWLGDWGWNQIAYVYFQAQNNLPNDKTVYVNDGYYGTYTSFYYDTYKVNRVDIGLQSFYYDYGDYKVLVGNNYYTSSEAWYGTFTVNSSLPYGNSIYVEFQPGVTPNIIPRKVK
ncbi:MAG: hypothetical protein ACK4GJ_02845 [bacterium]